MTHVFRENRPEYFILIDSHLSQMLRIVYQYHEQSLEKKLSTKTDVLVEYVKYLEFRK